MPLPQLLQDFDITNATVAVWLFKKSYPVPGGVPRFKGRWIDTDQQLDAALKQALIAKRDSILEVEEYGLLAGIEVGQALRVDALETHAALITAEAAAETADRKATNLKEVRNTDFYVVKLVSGVQVIHAVHRTDASWGPKRVANHQCSLQDDQLGLNTSPGFNISRMGFSLV